jgi:hypothetical protein
MHVTDRLWLMMKMLKENYDGELYQQQRLRKARSASLTEEEVQSCQAEAKKIVCEIGISMYEYSKRLRIRYNRTIEQEAIHHAIELGISFNLLQWSQPKRYDAEKGLVGRNIVLTENGFETLFDKVMELNMNMTHSLYMPKLGR